MTSKKPQEPLINPISYVGDSKPIQVDENGMFNPIQYISAEEKSFEEKEYLLLFKGTDEEGEDLIFFEFIVGRTALIKFIVPMLKCMEIYESFILVEDELLKNKICVYDFFKAMEERGNVDLEGVDIEDYSLERTHPQE